MTFDEELEKGIAEIIGGFQCPKDFKCYTSGFENLCKAKDIGIRSFLLCLEKNPRECKLSLNIGYESICECPLRFYIAKKLKK